MADAVQDLVERTTRDRDPGIAPESIARAAEEIAGLGASRALLVARGLLATDDQLRRELAARVLGRIAEDQATRTRAMDELVGMLTPDEDVVPLCAALAEIGELFGAQRARDPLLALVDDESYLVRWRLPKALHSAHTRGDAAVERALIRLAGDERSMVRSEAVDALGTLRVPASAVVLEALAASCEDDDERIVIRALRGIARSEEPLPAEALARVATRERIESMHPNTARMLFEALAWARRHDAFELLEGLRAGWHPADPAVSRALTSALAWCAPPEWTDDVDDAGEPVFDRRLARWLTGKRVIVGLDDPQAPSDVFQGVVARCDPTVVNIAIADLDQPLELPADTRAFRFMPPGRYLLTSGEFVTDPDAEGAWRALDDEAGGLE